MIAACSRVGDADWVPRRRSFRFVFLIGLFVPGLIPILLATACGDVAQERHPTADGDVGERTSPPTRETFLLTPAPGSPGEIAGGQAQSEASITAGAEFVGSVRCAGCHAPEARAWQGSHHQRAMTPARAGSVDARFDGESHVVGEDRWRLLRDGVHLIGEWQRAGRAPARLSITFRLGADPIEQFLVSREGGRLQVLPLAWDRRPVEQGGQRWFPLPRDGVSHPRDPLHWDGLAYTANSQCIECHTTQFESGFDSEAGEFASQFAGTNVGCEACHGPGGAHLKRLTEGPGRAQVDRGTPNSGKGTALPSDPGMTTSDFVNVLRSGPEDAWTRAAGARIALRQEPVMGTPEIEVCAPCHARRSRLQPVAEVGAPFLDVYLPSPIASGLYFEDGKMRDEVYVWGSFEQSRMHAAGVLCSDCHDPHSGALRREGNALCGGCHDSGSYDVARHRGHPTARPGRREGGDCVDCHMPSRIYMELDERRDHSFPVPSPVRSAALESPPICVGCHPGRAPEVAAQEIAGWGDERSAAVHWSEALVVAGKARGDAERWLEVAQSEAASANVRGSAWRRFAAEANRPPPRGVIEARLAAGDALEILGLIDLVRRLGPEEQVALLAPSLGHPRRAVRTAAAEVLIQVPISAWSGRSRAALGQAATEYRTAQEANAERPEAQVNLGLLWLAYDDEDKARSAFETALARAPYFVPARVNLADLERRLGNPEASVEQLRRAVEWAPEASLDRALVRYAYGLALHRAGRGAEALSALETAAAEAPDAPQIGLGYALALGGAGRRVEAIAALSALAARGVADESVYSAWSAFLREEGRIEEAHGVLERWRSDSPGNPRIEAIR